MKSYVRQLRGGGALCVYRSPEVLDAKTLERRVAHGGRKARRARIRLAKLYVSPEVRALANRLYEMACEQSGISLLSSSAPAPVAQ